MDLFFWSIPFHSHMFGRRVFPSPKYSHHSQRSPNSFSFCNRFVCKSSRFGVFPPTLRWSSLKPAFILDHTRNILAEHFCLSRTQYWGMPEDLAQKNARRFIIVYTMYQPHGGGTPILYLSIKSRCIVGWICIFLGVPVIFLSSYQSINSS